MSKVHTACAMQICASMNVELRLSFCMWSFDLSFRKWGELQPANSFVQVRQQSQWFPACKEIELLSDNGSRVKKYHGQLVVHNCVLRPIPRRLKAFLAKCPCRAWRKMSQATQTPRKLAPIDQFDMHIQHTEDLPHVCPLAQLLVLKPLPFHSTAKVVCPHDRSHG